jgi:integrase
MTRKPKTTPSSSGKRKTPLDLVYSVTAKGKRYHYAWRGGPPLPPPTDKAAFMAALSQAWADREQSKDPKTFADLIDAYQISPEYAMLAESTRAIRALRLKALAGDKIGRMPILALEARKAPSVFLAFRNAKAATPRAADEHIEAASVVLNWAMLHGWILKNPCARIPALYRRGARADKTWEVATFDAVQPILTPAARQIAALGAATGLRRGDLQDLRWSQVLTDRAMIRRPTNKSRGATVAWIPLTRAALDVLEAIGPKGDDSHVLLDDTGKPWQPAAMTKAINGALKQIGSDLHLHDLRGTYATLLYASGASDDEIEEQMGWERGQARARRRDYAREESVIASLAERLNGFAAKSHRIDGAGEN